MNTNVYQDKVIMFKSDAVDALKAASTISQESYIYVTIYDSVVVVSFDESYEELKHINKDRTMNNLMKKAINILNKYDIEYKIKGMKF